MNTLMKQLTPLIQQLREKPNSLIFGSSQADDLEPEKKTADEEH